jgi:hypothetical protein
MYGHDTAGDTTGETNVYAPGPTDNPVLIQDNPDRNAALEDYSLLSLTQHKRNGYEQNQESNVRQFSRIIQFHLVGS